MKPRLLPLAVLVLLAFTVSPAARASDQPLYDELPDERVLYVAPGQSLGNLVRKAYPNQPSRWEEIQQWVVEHNPHAFVDGDPGRLRGDVRLQLPSASAFARRQAGSTPTLADFDLVFDGRFLFVNPSQSLADLVPRIYPEQRDRWDAITRAIIDRNREILSDRDVEGRIARGTRLIIPSVVRAETTPEREPEPVVGAVVEAAGTVHATDGAGRRRALDTGDSVRRGDTVSTASGSSARIELRDGEVLFVRADSSVRVREWRLPDVGPGQRVIGLLKGGLRAISGALGNRAQDDYRTVTPAATMGIRGTDYSMQLCEPDACTGSGGDVLDPGLYVSVASGEIELLNAAGEAVYSAGEYGFVADSDSAPRHIDADAAPATVAQRLEPEPEPEQGSESEPESDDDSSPWLIGIGLLLLIAL